MGDFTAKMFWHRKNRILAKLPIFLVSKHFTA